MDISNNLSKYENIHHILISQKYRELITLIFEMADNVTDEYLLKSLSDALQEARTNVIVYVASIKKTYLEENIREDIKYIRYNIECIYFNIPKELVEQLIQNNMTDCIFYIGKSDDISKILISSNEPTNDNISKKNSNGQSLPYKSTLLKFETIQ